MSIIFAVIFLGICQVLAVAGLAWLLRRALERKQAEILETINAELSKLVAGEPCQSATVINAIATNIGRTAGLSVKNAFASDLGKVKLAENATEREQQLSMITESNPGVGAVLAGMGKRGSGKMLSSPIVQLALSALLNRGGAPAGGSSDNHGSEPPRSMSL
jgi:hypothetical protein